jgi:hypothetical protein
MASASKQKAAAQASKRPPPPPPEEEDDDEEETHLFDLFVSLCVIGREPDEATGKLATETLERLDKLAREAHPKERKEAVFDWDDRVLDELDVYVPIACQLIESGLGALEAAEKAVAIVTGFDAQFGDDEDE